MSTHPVQVSFEERRDNKCSHIAAKDVPGKKNLDFVQFLDQPKNTF